MNIGITSFNGGLTTPQIDARSDTEKYASSCRELVNMMPLVYGGVTRRPGTEYIATAKNSPDSIRLIRFVYSTSIAYVCEFGDKYIRFFYGGSPVASEIVSPYAVSDLPSLQIKQIGDVMWLVHSKYAQRKLTRTSPDSFALTIIPYEDGPFLDRNDIVNYNGVTMTCSTDAEGATGTLTASSATFLPGHVGSIWQLIQTRRVSSATLTSTAVGAGDSIEVKGTFTFTTHGTWAATVVLERNVDGAGWDSYRTWVGDSDTNITLSVVENESNVQYRTNVTAYTSGTVTSLISVDVSTYTGVVRVDSVASSTVANITVLSALSGVAKSIRSITLGNPMTIITNTQHGLTAGQSITITGCGGTTQVVNGTYYVVTVYSAYQFSVRATHSLVVTADDNLIIAKNAYGRSGAGITGLTPSFMTSNIVYPSIIDDTGGFWHIALYKEAARSTLIAHTATFNGNGDTVLTADSSSGVGGVITVANFGSIAADVNIVAAATVIDSTLFSAYTGGGVIGTSTSTSTATFRWAEGAWSDVRGYPAAIAFCEDRIVYGGTDNNPQTLWFSHTGDYENFEEGVLDSSSFSLVLMTTNRVRWMEMLDSLVVGTSGDEWAVASNKLGQPITPTNFTAKQQKTYGSANMQAIRTQSATLFVDYVRRKIREMAYNAPDGQYTAPDLTVLAENITESGIAAVAMQHNPDQILWCALADGTLLSLTYERDQNVVAWAEHYVGGISDSSPFTSESELSNPSGGDGSAPRATFKLTPCDEADPIYYTVSNLSAYIGKVIKIAESADVCYTVSANTDNEIADGAATLTAYYNTCDDCSPPVAITDCSDCATNCDDGESSITATITYTACVGASGCQDYSVVVTLVHISECRWEYRNPNYGNQTAMILECLNGQWVITFVNELLFPGFCDGVGVVALVCNGAHPTGTVEVPMFDQEQQGAACGTATVVLS
jgi:hypothetical protein